MHVPSAAAIDAAIAGDADLKMIGTYGAGDAGVESLRCRKTVYVPATYVSLLLSGDLTPIEAWQRLRESIVDAVAEDACRPIVDWLRADLTRSGPAPSPPSWYQIPLLLYPTHSFWSTVTGCFWATCPGGTP